MSAAAAAGGGATGGAAATGGGGGGSSVRLGVEECPAAAALMPLLLVMSKVVMEVQDLQPLAMQTGLARAITFTLPVT